MTKSSAYVIAFIGPAGSGKDTAAEPLLGAWGRRGDENWSRNLKFAAPLKDMCSSLFGWDRERIDTDLEYKESIGTYADGSANMNKQGTPQTRRQILQLVGTDLMRNQVNDDVWLQAALQTTRAAPNVGLWIVTDARFVNEIDFLRANFENVLVVRLGRKGATEGTEAHNHISEMQSAEIVADETIIAEDGDVEGLQDWAFTVVDTWLADLI